MNMSIALPKQEQSHLSDIELSGCRLVADVDGCLFWPEESLLCVSDLHLEKGSSFAVRSGVLLPPYDTAATLARLALCIKRWNPKTVISLGDSFHDLDGPSRITNREADCLRSMMAGRNWIWVCGNHDPEPPKELGGTSCEEILIGPLLFRHEPRVDCATGEVAGHPHPCAKIRRRGKSVRRRCFAADGRRAILPAFGAYTGGLNLLDAPFRDMFEPSGLVAWMLGKDRVYRVDQRQLVR